MQRLIKNGELINNEWHLADDIAESADNNVVIPLVRFVELAEKGEIDYQNIGVSLASDDDILALENHVDKLQIIALNFSAFADGRSFSQARMLREQLDFTGEIRAVGAFMQDQLFYLSRCGVDAFLLPEGTNVDSALMSLKDFSETYQAACDEPQPLFRRRV